MRSVIKMMVILLTGMIIGTLCICAVYLLPVEQMQENVRKSLEAFMAEGENPFVLEGYKGSSLDNYTDAIMLGSAVYGEDHGSLPERAMRVSRASGVEDAPMESLALYLKGEKTEEHTEYARYWHGYLVILKPLLSFFDYMQIRGINGVFILCIIIWIVLELLRKKMWKGVIAYLLAVFSMFPMAIPYSLQFSTVFYIGNIALLLVVKKNSEWVKKNHYLYFFEIVGMCTSYFDFLTYPLFTFGMPMVMCLILNKEVQYRKKLQFIINNGIAWGFGYGIMWAGKWLIGSLLTGENLLDSALGVVTFRMSGQAYEEKLNRVMAVLRNGYIYFNFIGIALAVLVIVWIIVFIYRKHRKVKGMELLPLGLVACMPVLWYLTMANHSYIHYWYTFRALAVSVFALTMIPEYIKEKTLETRRTESEI